MDNPNGQQTEHVLRTRAEGLTAHSLELRPKPGRSNNKSKNLPNESGVGLAVVANDLNLLSNKQKGIHNTPMRLR